MDEVGSKQKPIMQTVWRTPVREDVTKLANAQDRVQILKEIFPYVETGARKISDVQNVLAAQIKKCEM